MAEKAKVRPINIDRFMADPPFNRVIKMGVELEGGWIKTPVGVALERDTSVFGGISQPGYKVGELPIGAVQPVAIKKLLAKYYPDLTDSTCGMHVHMSFENAFQYSVLEVPEYQETMVEYLHRWALEENLTSTHPIWPRLAGKNEFCRKEFWPDMQVSTTRKDWDHNRKGHRYTMIHYCGRLATIECRILPMMENAEIAFRAVDRVRQVTNACLMVLAPTQRHIKERVKIELPDEDRYEETIEIEIPLSGGQRKALNRGTR